MRKYPLCRLPVFLAVFFAAVFFSACSTAPRRSNEAFSIRNMAASQLELANLNASQGRFTDALFILDDAWLLAVSADDPILRVNIVISRGNILFSLELFEEAQAAWESAASEGDLSGLPLLAARARLYSLRSRLVLLSAQMAAQADASAEEMRAQILREIALVRSDQLALASGYITLAFVEKQLQRWADAENAAVRALRIYERGRFLEDAAFAWFVIASIRSLSGNYNAALGALRTSITFDRRAENGFGLASSWHAMGEVYERAGRAEDASAARRRAAEIYRAIGFSDRAEELEGLL
ncbi:MAG: DUF1517 domain-containing protein [Treponema sp.]|nr:DUF1517 domain-containing protein [Treponema sp.]